jgi:hypothetical protein
VDQFSSVHAVFLQTLYFADNVAASVERPFLEDFFLMEHRV